MCGIVGHVGPRARSLEARVRGARESMTHRGPDDAGLWGDDHAVLGSRRLAILDLSPAGHMPMASADGRHVLVFNGAIYNYVELRAELAREVEFRSTGDTEVILQGFRVWGWDRLLDRLDGMFAFALWDAREHTLYAARDRMGEKPFFYGRHDDGLSFASTLAALMRLRGGPAIVDVRALDAYLTYQAVPAPLAIFEGTAQLPPAHELRFSPDTGELRISRYWDLHFAPKRRLRELDALNEIDGMVRRSVGQRLRSDVPTGTLLSGGVDSSLVTALASQESGRAIDAVTMGFHETAFDERAFARVVASRHGVTLHEEVLTPRVATDLPAIVWHYGQPLADVSIVPSYYMARAARRFMTVALVGDGADETFGGYARPMVERAASVYRALLPSALRRKLGAALGDRPGTRSAGFRRRLALLAGAGAGSAADAFVYDRAFRRLRDGAYSGSFLAALDGWHPDSLYRDAWSRAVAADDVDRALYGDVTTYLPDQLLAKADVSAMAHGLETRSPFLAREVVEYAATLPTALRLRGWTTKYLLKRVAERYVPRDVLHRPKRGFVMPVAEWLRGDLEPFARATLGSARFLDRGWLEPDAVQRLLVEHRDGRRDWGQQLWTLMILEIWARLALDGSLAPSDPLDVHALAESGR
ncbi:MAG TPA: asparagine synthase (glutamine-hydrolyzing) [Conexibacter sp.]|nr:asparagine synthase (glutamine-hydrolyzing) [Conexibacter sp.]